MTTYHCFNSVLSDNCRFWLDCFILRQPRKMKRTPCKTLQTCRKMKQCSRKTKYAFPKVIQTPREGLRTCRKTKQTLRKTLQGRRKTKRRCRKTSVFNKNKGERFEKYWKMYHKQKTLECKG